MRAILDRSQRGRSTVEVTLPVWTARADRATIAVGAALAGLIVVALVVLAVSPVVTIVAWPRLTSVVWSGSRAVVVAGTSRAAQLAAECVQVTTKHPDHLPQLGDLATKLLDLPRATRAVFTVHLVSRRTRATRAVLAVALASLGRRGRAIAIKLAIAVSPGRRNGLGTIVVAVVVGTNSVRPCHQRQGNEACGHDGSAHGCLLWVSRHSSLTRQATVCCRGARIVTVTPGGLAEAAVPAAVD